MAAIDSRQAGILRPLAGPAIVDPTDKIRSWVAGLVALPVQSVRRRWAPRPGLRPNIGEDWAAVGVDKIISHGTPLQLSKRGELDKPESGDITRVTHQTLECVASFYGPNALAMAEEFRETARISQNISALESECGCVLQWIEPDITHLPDFLCEQWVDRYDVRFKIGRAASRTYGVRTICAADSISIVTEKG